MLTNPKRGEIELAALIALEKSVKRLASEFPGYSALNFYHEAELSAFLLESIRNSPGTCEYMNKICIHLAHLEWPCLEKRSIDIVLWRPGGSQKAKDLWRNRGKCAKNVPLLAAVQVKRGPGCRFSK